MFKTKYEQLQEVLNTLGPGKARVGIKEESLAAMQREHHELRMMGLEDGNEGFCNESLLMQQMQL